MADAQQIEIIVASGGIPIPVGRRQFSALDVVELVKNALATDYNGLDPKKQGMSKGAAAFLKLAEEAQDGDKAALDFLLDRFIGKPVQQTKNLNVSASMAEFLAALENEAERPAQDPMGSDL